MTLPLPRLDDRTWQDLRDEGVSLIPRLAAQWTDHNASDPGITILELLAYHTEASLYRLDQVGAPALATYLRLFGSGQLPSGVRPAATLLQYAPRISGDSTRRTFIEEGSFLTPRFAPTSPIARPRRRNSGIGEEGWELDVRRSGEPDAPMMNPDPPPAEPATPPIRFRAAHPLQATGIEIGAIQSFDGERYLDVTESFRRTGSAAIWGEDPCNADQRPMDAQPAVYLGFHLDGFEPASIVSGRNWGLTLWYLPAHSGGRIAGTQWGPLDDFVSGRACDSQRAASLQTVWEYRLRDRWEPIQRSAPFRDETDGFETAARIVIPGKVFAWAKEFGSKDMIGATPAPYFYVRCRLVKGCPDAPPRMAGLFADAVLVEQWDESSTPCKASWDCRLVPPRPTKPKTLRRLLMSEEQKAEVAEAATDLGSSLNWEQWPLWSKDGFRDEEGPPLAPDRSSMRAVVLGVGTGLPGQSFPLRIPPAPDSFNMERKEQDADEPPQRVIAESVRVWTLEPPWAWKDGVAPNNTRWKCIEWARAFDLSGGHRRASLFQLETSSSASNPLYDAPASVAFGDGQKGRVPPPGSLVVAQFAWTQGEAANLSSGFAWTRAEIEDPFNADSPPVWFRNPIPATGGVQSETLPGALSRLARDFGASEELVRRAQQASQATLDGLPLVNLAMPDFAVNLLDFEALARSVPGTVVSRSQAWANANPERPGILTPGCVTVVILPQLPVGRPTPSENLLRRVSHFLNQRRAVGCQVFVDGPTYVPVWIRAVLHVSDTLANQTRQEAEAALRQFLHPLRGGDRKNGWPFGRSIHPGELLRVLAEVPNVCHVTRVRIAAPGQDWTESAFCVPEMALPDLLRVELETRCDP